MHPPTKDQTTIDVENPTIDASDGAIITLPNGEIEENKDTARQEFKDEADINYMLSRFGVAPPRGAPTYGEWDDTFDLQQAIDSTREAKRAFNRLPEDLQRRFDRMEDLLSAVENGSLVIKDEEFKEPGPAAGTPPAVPPA